ncbi:MAG: NAD-binding protein [Planctomycetes bacterium]|nr:NAD-binding protein [Planctomycetota bacterium]
MSDVLPLRDLFTSLFFISLGMLLDLRLLLESPAAVLLLFGALLLGKLLVVVLCGLVMRLPLRAVLLSGVALAQVGEFSFILGELGGDLGLMDPRELAVFLDASVLTMLVTPLLMSWGPHLVAGAHRLRRLERMFGLRDLGGHAQLEPLQGHVVVLGCGVGGQLLMGSLCSAGIPHVVVDLDPDRVRAARALGMRASYGDATSPEILARARVADAAHVAVLLNDPEATLRVVRAVRKLSGSVPITARARFLEEVASLRGSGATHAVAQEVEASLELVEHVLVSSQVPLERADAIVSAARESLSARPPPR